MRRDSLACPEPLAGRRFAYGQAAAKDGDWAAAADMFAQTLERVPHWAPAHFALGEAREKLGDADGAARAFRAALAADPADAEGAGARLALIDGETPEALPPAYVARLFDDYAPRFDAHLTQTLAYRGPALLLAALDEAAPDRRFAHALDLGCGAGLMGAGVRSRVERLAGIDLSAGMIREAAGRGVYDTLEAVDALAFLERAPAGVFDLALAADVLCYMGDLAPLLRALAPALTPGGLFAFTAERIEGQSFRLRETIRFAHAPAYIDEAARGAGFRRLVLHSVSTRREGGADVPGLVAVFETSQARAG